MSVFTIKWLLGGMLSVISNNVQKNLNFLQNYYSKRQSDLQIERQSAVRTNKNLQLLANTIFTG